MGRVHRLLHPAAAALAVILFADGATAQVKSAKSNVWKALEAGVTQEIRVMGSSMSQTSKSSWPGELQKQLNEQLPGEALVMESGTANGQTSRTGRFDVLPGVIDREPDAIIMEYAFTDSRGSKGVPLEEHITNMTAMVDAIRDALPSTEVFIYETGRLSYQTDEDTPMLLTYYEATRGVATDRGTYLFQTSAKFTTIMEQMVEEGRPEDWTLYVYDSHHPTQKAAVEIIVPEMLSVMQGLGSAPLEPSVALSVQSLAGRSFYVGDTAHIQWYYDPARVPSVELLLSVDGGQNFAPMLSSPLQASSYLWPIPAELGGTATVTEQAVVKVRGTGGSHEDVTGRFTILPATDKEPLTLHALSKKVYSVSDTLHVSWAKDPNRVDGVEVELSVDGGQTWLALNTDAISDVTTFAWPIPAVYQGVSVLSGQAVVRVQDYDKKYQSVSALFAIHGPPHIVDDADPGVEIVGYWERNGKYPNGYNGQYLDDKREGRGEKSVTYSYTIPAEGTYAVYAWTPYAGTGIEDETPTIIIAGDGSHTVPMDMKRITEWQLLGEYPYESGFEAKVTITNDVSGGGTVVADAIKWEMTSGDASTAIGPGGRSATPWNLAKGRQRVWYGNGGLHFDSPRGVRTVRVYDSAGRLLGRPERVRDGALRVHTGPLAPGVYTAVVEQGRTVARTHLIVAE